MSTTISGNGTSSFGGAVNTGGAVTVTGDVAISGNLTEGGTPVWRTQVNAAQATTSGTFIDLPAVPSWVKRITIAFNGVSTNGADSYLVQGGAGSIESSGYASASAAAVNGAVSQGASSTSGFIIPNGNAANIFAGHVVLTFVGSNTWACSISLGQTAGIVGVSGGGNKTFSGTLDRIRLTTTGGTNAFDAGSISSIYEG